MEKIIDFFINVGKLKDKKRRGWEVHRIKKAESTASHIFRMAILSWFLTEKEKLNIEKVLKMALIHDLCEVFTEDDETPYDPLLPKEVDSLKAQRKIKEILKKWPKFSLEEKREKGRQKFEREHKAFLKLVSNLPSNLREELENLWIDFEKKLSKEGRFVKQADKVENFLQGMEYWQKYGRIQKDLWMRWAKEIFDIPVLVEFEKAIERRFFEGGDEKGEMDEILNFLIEIGKLKSLKRRGWVLRGVKDPETVADHTFSLALESWLLGKKRELVVGRALKLALVHDMCEVYGGDITPYDSILPSDKKRLAEVMKIWPRFSGDERKKINNEKFEIEWSSLVKLAQRLPPQSRRKIKGFWIEFKKRISKEAKFVSQLDKIDNLLQALEYRQRDKNFPIRPWWIEIEEKIDDPLLVECVKILDKRGEF